MWIWTLVEVYLAIICACGPALKPLFGTYVTPKIISPYRHTFSKQSTYGTPSCKTCTPTSKNFSTPSRQSHASTSQIIGGVTGLGYGKPNSDQGMEMHIVIQSEIEQVEEEVFAGAGSRAANWPLREEPWAGV